MSTDPFVQFKAAQREGWGLFAPLEAITIPSAFRLVEFAEVKKGQHVLDVACGTGVVAVTAARMGAEVKGLDLSPVLLERARWNAEVAQCEIEFKEGDVEQLPYVDGSFDVVLSQFGHMFAPRPLVAITEMLRVLKPQGRIAFTTWPPELFTGRMFALVGQFLPLPEGASPPPLWGEPTVVRERLGDKVTHLQFDRGSLFSPALSMQHIFTNFSKTAGPVVKLLEALKSEPQRLKEFREKFDEITKQFTRGNTVEQQFLLTRAVKK